MNGTNPQLLSAYLPLVLLFVIMYFLLIRPQQIQQKKRRELLNSIKKGDKVLTLGGIYGTVTDLTDDTITLRIADKVEIKMAKSSVTQVFK